MRWFGGEAECNEKMDHMDEGWRRLKIFQLSKSQQRGAENVFIGPQASCIGWNMREGLNKSHSEFVVRKFLWIFWKLLFNRNFSELTERVKLSLYKVFHKAFVWIILSFFLTLQSTSVFDKKIWWNFLRIIFSEHFPKLLSTWSWTNVLLGSDFRLLIICSHDPGRRKR